MKDNQNILNSDSEKLEYIEKQSKFFNIDLGNIKSLTHDRLDDLVNFLGRGDAILASAGNIINSIEEFKEHNKVARFIDDKIGGVSFVKDFHHSFNDSIYNPLITMQRDLKKSYHEKDYLSLVQTILGGVINTHKGLGRLRKEMRQKHPRKVRLLEASIAPIIVYLSTKIGPAFGVAMGTCVVAKGGVDVVSKGRDMIKNYKEAKNLKKDDKDFDKLVDDLVSKEEISDSLPIAKKILYEEKISPKKVHGLIENDLKDYNIGQEHKEFLDSYISGYSRLIQIAAEERSSSQRNILKIKALNNLIEGYEIVCELNNINSKEKKELSFNSISKTIIKDWKSAIEKERGLENSKVNLHSKQNPVERSI